MTNMILSSLLALTLAADTPSASVDPASVTRDAAVAGVQTFYEKVSDFSADFRQTVKRKNMPRARKLRGRVGFKKPGMMRWDYRQPEKVLYVSDGAVLWNYQPEDGVAYKLNVKDSELYNALKFLFGQGNLEKEFKVKLLEPSKGLVRLHLSPRVKQTNYKAIELRVDPKTFEIRTSVLTDPLGSRSTITFSNIKYAPIDAKVFTGFTPKKGVRIQDMTIPSAKAGAPTPAKSQKPAPSKAAP